MRILRYHKKKNTPSFGGINNHVYLIDSTTNERTEIFENLPGLHFNLGGQDNVIEVMTPIGSFKNCTIFIDKTSNAHIRFENNIYLQDCFFSIFNGTHQKCYIDKYTSFAGGAIINIHNNSGLHIHEDCMFSNQIVIWTSDGHALLDSQTHKLLNQPQDCLTIGKHCWIGFGAKIFKGGGLNDNSVLGAGSVLTRKFNETNIVVAGNPCRIVRQDIEWSRQPPQNFY